MRQALKGPINSLRASCRRPRSWGRWTAYSVDVGLLSDKFSRTSEVAEGLDGAVLDGGGADVEGVDEAEVGLGVLGRAGAAGEGQELVLGGRLDALVALILSNLEVVVLEELDNPLPRLGDEVGVLDALGLD